LYPLSPLFSSPFYFFLKLINIQFKQNLMDAINEKGKKQSQSISQIFTKLASKMKLRIQINYNLLSNKKIHQN